MLSGRLGTAGFMAPEIHLGEDYSGQSVDLFASAIILFIVLTRRLPFCRAHPSDSHYYNLVSYPKKFWDAHAEAEGGEDIYSDEFKDLFEKMMSFDPNLRPNLQEVLSHPWMMGDLPTCDEINDQFQKRRVIVKEAEKTAREERKQQ